MQQLKTNRQVLTWLCLHPADEDTSKLKKMSYIICTIAVIFIVSASVLAGSIYIFKFISSDLLNCLFEVTYIIIFVDGLYTIGVMLIARRRTKATFESLARIYDANEDEETFQYLVQVDSQCEWIWSMYFKFLIIVVFFGFVMCFLSMLLCWLSGAFVTQCFFHPAYLILPWNQQTTIGYLAEFSFAIVFSYCYFIFSGANILLFVSICLHHRAFYKMFQHSARQLNDRKGYGNHEEHLKHLIRFHRSVKDWFLESAQLMSPYIMVHLVFSIIFIAAAVFQLDLQLQDIDWRIYSVLNLTGMPISNLFIHCFFGKAATDSFVQMPDSLYEINWQKFPIKLQKHLILMIVNMQQPLYYFGFGIAILNLENFCKLMNTVYSYYMMFKTVTSDD